MSEKKEINMVYIENVNRRVTEPILKELIQQRVSLEGKIQYVCIKQKILHLGYAHVIFEKRRDALATVEHLNGHVYNGARLTTSLIANKQEINVIRIVNLGETFTEPTLKDFIQQTVALEGKIQNLYLRKDEDLGLVYAYIIFEKGCDALETVEHLNGYVHNEKTFDAALIDPDLPCNISRTKLTSMRVVRGVESDNEQTN